MTKAMKIGDIITIAPGYWCPSVKWWQFWKKQRYVTKLVVTAISENGST